MAAEWNKFFENSQQPKNYDEHIKEMKEFMDIHRSHSRDIVFISSGGTTVPLECHTVRYIDNFSVGTRGSTSAEHFLSHGYAVIFLHRRGSLEPYKRHFMHMNFLDMLEVEQNREDRPVTIKKVHQDKIFKLLEKYNAVKSSHQLLSIDFTTLSEYLHYLKGASQVLSIYGHSVMFYLAAAVSDFYIPSDEMPEHKIQSGEGPLQISLQLVPKMLLPLVREWATKTYIVSFKLETDQNMLIPKAKLALEKYSHQIVVANILETRKKEVILVMKDTELPIRLTDEELKAGVEIEERIVSHLFTKHQEFKQN